MRRPQTSDHGAQCTPEMQLRDTSFRERGILRCSCFVAYLIMNSSAGSPAAQLWMGSLTKLEVDVGEQRLTTTMPWCMGLR